MFITDNFCVAFVLNAVLNYKAISESRHHSAVSRSPQWAMVQ